MAGNGGVRNEIAEKERGRSRFYDRTSSTPENL